MKFVSSLVFVVLYATNKVTLLQVIEKQLSELIIKKLSLGSSDLNYASSPPDNNNYEKAHYAHLTFNLCYKMFIRGNCS